MTKVSKYQKFELFNLAMFPAIWMGVFTNIYIASILIWIGLSEVLLSPIIGTIIFLTLFYLIKKKKINSENAFFIIAYTVSIEIIIHTHFLGWNTGFVYYLILLPIVFLLNVHWKYWQIVVFNISVIVIFLILWMFYFNSNPIKTVDKYVVEGIRSLNIAGIGSILFVIIIYFSRSIYKKETILQEFNEELAFQNQEIKNQHHQLQILVKEIHHRVKNNLQIISSLMSLQLNSENDKEVVRVLSESRMRIDAIALIHQKLYQDKNVNQVDFKSYLEELVDNQKVIHTSILFEVQSESSVLNLDTAVPMGIIVSELITNALKHAYKGIEDPKLTIIFKELKEGKKYLEVQDNGIGLPNNFSFSEASGLGSDIISSLIDQIDAEIQFDSKDGARFKIYF